MKGMLPLRHSPSVRTISCCTMFLAVMWADETQDRAAIEKVIAALNEPARRAYLFTKDADSDVDFDRLVDLHRLNSSNNVVIGMNEPWTQMTIPRIASERIRFITADVAIVDGASRLDEAVTLARRVPLLFVMKKEGADWRITAVRLLTVRQSVLPRIIHLNTAARPPLRPCDRPFSSPPAQPPEAGARAKNLCGQPEPRSRRHHDVVGTIIGVPVTSPVPGDGSRCSGIGPGCRDPAA